MPARVLVVGDVALDVLVTPAAPPQRGADVPASVVSRPGGAGANTAAWLAHLGVPVTLCARIGDDAAGRAALPGLPVTRAVTVDPDRPTATVVALLDAGERTLLSDRGAAAALDPADLPDLDGVTHLHLSGYVLVDPATRATGRAALAAARAAGLTTSVDPQVAPALTPRFLDDVRGIDLLLPNAAELAALGGVETVLAAVGAVAWTAGADGATWADRNGRRSRPARAVEVVDATGAGDAFDAGLLAGWLRGDDPAAALDAGLAAAAAAVGRLGARP